MIDARTLNQEFSDEFDVLYNNISSNQAPGLDQYEKSLFLTRAQDDIVKSYFNPMNNKLQAGYDDNQRRQIDFSMITKSKVYNSFSGPIFDLRTNTRSVTLDDTDEILMFINEYVEVTRDGKTDQRLVVDPIDYNEYSRIMQKPYKRPTKNRAWRLLDNTGGVRKSEIIVGPTDILTKYVVRYIKRPRAIILNDFGTAQEHDVTIDGCWQMQPCELDPILYPEIIQRAVELAWAAYKEPSLGNQLSLNSMSKTDIGMSAPSNDRRQQQ